MKATPEGDGTLLDSLIALYGSGMGDADLHSALDLPVLLVGGGGGTLKGGRYLKYPHDTPMTNMHLNLLRKVGAPQEALGDSTAELVGL